jgi:Ca2+-binding EF-hand superfamily protein
MALDTDPEEDDRVSARLQNALHNLSEIVVHAEHLSDPSKRRPSSTAGAEWHEKMLQLENSISRIRSITSNYEGSDAGGKDHYDHGSFGGTIYPQKPPPLAAPKPTVMDRELEYARQWNNGPPSESILADEDPPKSARSGQQQNGPGPSPLQALRPLTPKAPPRPVETPQPLTPRGSWTPSSRPGTPVAQTSQKSQVSSVVSRNCQNHPLFDQPRKSSENLKAGEADTMQNDMLHERSSSQKELQINGSRKDLHIQGSSSRKDLQIAGSASRKDLQVEGGEENKGLLQEKELKELSRMIGEKAALRFKSLRDCFRFVDTVHSGQVSVNGVVRLCRLFNVDDNIAERFFRLLDVDGNGFVDFREICIWLGPHIQPGYHPPKLSQSPAHQLRKIPTFERPLGVPPPEGKDDESEARRREIQRLSWLVASKASLKFKTINECFRHIDADRDGMVQRSELHHFFRSFNLEIELADRFFDLLDVQGIGEIDYNELRAHIGAYLAPGYKPPQGAGAKVEVSVQKRGRPQSARSHRDEQTKQAKIKALMDERAKTKAVNQMINTLSSKAFFRFKSARELFRFADENKDGKISEQELCRFIESFGLPRSTAEQYFKFLDKDKSGEVSFAEFMNFFGPIIQPGQQQYPLPEPPPSVHVPEARKLSSERKSHSAKQLQLQRPSSAASTASGSSKASSSSKSSKESSLSSSSKSSDSSKSSSKSSRQRSASRHALDEFHQPGSIPMIPVDSRHRVEACNNIRGQACWFPQEYEPSAVPRPRSPPTIPPYAENLKVENTARVRSSRTFNSSRVADRLSSFSPERSWQMPVAPKPKVPETPKPDRTPRFRMVTNASSAPVRSEIKDVQGRLIREAGTRGRVVVAMRTDLDEQGRPMTPRSLGHKMQQEEALEEPDGSMSQPLLLTSRAVLGVSRPKTLDHQGNACFDCDHGAIEPFRTVGEALGSSIIGTDTSELRLNAIPPAGESPRGRGSRSPGRVCKNHLGQPSFDISGKAAFHSVAEALGRTW